jgi:glycine betaine/choline ABC-type transport system substrate-binding protein
MKHAIVTMGAGAAALALVLSACGSSGSSATGGGGASGTLAAGMRLGGPAEFKTRPDGVPGLQRIYGVTFQGYTTLDTGGPLTVTALKNGQVDAADLFTTDPAIKSNNFVVLTDPKSDFGAQNVLPLITRSKATPGVTTVLNFISSRLTTDDLIELRTKVEVNKQDPDQAAKQWLAAQNPPTTTPAAGVTIAVGSANFPENVVLADIYADALQAAGATVSKQLNIGTREKYLPALEDGSIDLLPEYSGVLLQYFDKHATATSSDAVYADLKKAVPAKLTVLAQSQAQDADAIVVTAETAKKYGLTSIGDLAKKKS